MLAPGHCSASHSVVSKMMILVFFFDVFLAAIAISLLPQSPPRFPAPRETDCGAGGAPAPQINSVTLAAADAALRLSAGLRRLLGSEGAGGRAGPPHLRVAHGLEFLGQAIPVVRLAGGRDDAPGFGAGGDAGVKLLEHRHDGLLELRL